MDFLTRKEIEKLKGEFASKDAALEAEKYSFERQLKNGLGNEIILTLNNPPKPCFITKIKLKIAKWKLLYKEHKIFKKYKTNLK